MGARGLQERRGRARVRAVCVAVVVVLLAVAAPAQAEAPDASVEGRVAFADGSAWDTTPWRVDAVPVDAAAEEASTSTAEDGSFRIDGLAPGRYRLRAVPDEEGSGIPPMWLGGTLREDEATVLQVTAGSTRRGLVVERFTGQDVPRRATAVWRPYVKGTPKVGWTLTAEPHRWEVVDDWWGVPTEVPDDLFTFQWLADGKAVAGATGRTFTPTARQLGARLSVRVGVDLPNTTTSNDTSVRTGQVASGTNTPCTPVSVERSRSTLTARAGCWSASPTTVGYRWSVAGKAVPRATRATFTPSRSQRGKRITVRVTATAPGYRTVTTTVVAPTVRR